MLFGISDALELELQWHIDIFNQVFPQPAGPLLAKLAFQKLYKRQARPEETDNLVVRDEYLGWVMEGKSAITKMLIHNSQIDYYGVTFDHLVSTSDNNPEVLQINIIEMDNDGGAYAEETLLFKPWRSLGVVKRGKGLRIKRGLTLG
ncbi:unnamed protein product [Clonostachys rhizophaga]|uniref:Uncharacterized protein n=1 Tax=Clonostachys rhizophaga TaxID=160324 RepID=A0A9N9YJ21_9HYPO|nr:unnamed protein product [Clonostachys rhizophaga]